MADDRFFPCNDREAKILAELEEPSLTLYKAFRNDGATVTEALEKIELAEEWAKK